MGCGRKLSIWTSICWGTSLYHFFWTYFQYFGKMLNIVLQCKKLISDIGDMMSVQVIVEGSMNSSNPYFSSCWRRDFSVSVFLVNNHNKILSYSISSCLFSYQIMIVMHYTLPWENMIYPVWCCLFSMELLCNGMPNTSSLLLLHRSWDKYCSGLHLVFPITCLVCLWYPLFYRTNVFLAYIDNTCLHSCQGGFILDMGVHFIAGLRMVTAFWDLLSLKQTFELYPNGCHLFLFYEFLSSFIEHYYLSPLPPRRKQILLVFLKFKMLLFSKLTKPIKPIQVCQ